MESRSLPASSRGALLGKQTSRPNKLWIAVSRRAEGFFIEWSWQDVPYRSRLRFRFEPEGPFHVSRSYEEDVAPLLKVQERAVKVSGD